MSRPFRRRAAAAALLLGCLALLALLSGCCCLGGMPAPGEGTLGGVVEEGWQKIRDAGYRAEIRELERKGGAEASRRLLELARTTQGSHYINNEAIRALGRLGRREDVPALIEYSGWNRKDLPGGIPYGLHLVSGALADIGGLEACAALTELFRDRIPRLGRSASDPDVDIGRLAATVERAGCMEEQELLSVLRSMGSDLWMTRRLQETALRFLAARGDVEAAARQAKNTSLLAIEDADYPGLEELVVRADVPWWLRVFRMLHYVRSPLPRERLFHTYFRMLVAVYPANPPKEKNAGGAFVSWAGDICSSYKSSWAQGTSSEYFASKRGELREVLPSGLFERVDGWIAYAEGIAPYIEAHQRRGRGEANVPIPPPPALPTW